ncbi:hypothetical protein QEN58_14265 [Halomonas alkaliantarctica]|uniref:Uncharacterized protein n=1 Tax=Halomonas alkaliantarctica TaxID=232346 RepID=A0ABY8LMC5_9GAMM|nr:hypothetical protein [Halomonas alkaliantarctica]WGI24489.1 hypothetical protein QEN58_14265 [Halomonas alkaliantarctica]
MDEHSDNKKTKSIFSKVFPVTDKNKHYLNPANVKNNEVLVGHDVKLKNSKGGKKESKELLEIRKKMKESYSDPGAGSC